ncbi:endomucin isoform X3 [Coturnix japonica]|uniref:endomucin isoform X3 n=1 Tax=Coturnix japonica TaxID=93934 RepID=UPI0013A5EBA4|nr:endomucin isoform X3 [Coturnix japonica]
MCLSDQKGWSQAPPLPRALLRVGSGCHGYFAGYFAVYLRPSEEDEISNATVNANVSASTQKTEEEALNTTTLRATTPLATELTTTTASTMTMSITTRYNTTTSANATESTTQHTTAQQPAQVTTTARTESENTTNAVQVHGTQSAQNESLSATTTKMGTLTPTASLQVNTTASGTSVLSVSTLLIPTDSGSTANSSEKTKALEDTIHYSSVILPVVIALIVITLSTFSLVALYRVCNKKTPDRQENGTEQAQSDKEGVKLLSVKTTSAETGENSSQGKNKTRQCDDSSSNFSNKYM